MTVKGGSGGGRQSSNSVSSSSGITSVAITGRREQNQQHFIHNPSQLAGKGGKNSGSSNTSVVDKNGGENQGNTNMKWFSGKVHDSGPQLLSLSPLRLDEEGVDDSLMDGLDGTSTSGVFFAGGGSSRMNGGGDMNASPSAPSTPGELLKRRSRGRSKMNIFLNC